jgi:hypothetical protein
MADAGGTTHVCAPAHWLFITHELRQRLSDAQRSGAGQGLVALHAFSLGSSQTPFEPETTHRLPGGQSVETVQALWQCPNAQTRGLSQSLLIEQLPASPC